MAEFIDEELLQNNLIERYLSNLEFLKKEDSKLYEKINLFSNMIDTGIYKEKFALEYIKENNEFDILELQTNKYLYQRNSKKINEIFLLDIDFTDRFTFNNLSKKLYSKKDKNIELRNTKKEQLDNYLYNDISEYSDVLGNIENENYYKQIDKFLFLGNLLGLHLNEIMMKLKVKSCFIYEPNLEIFRLSLFVTDYKILSNNVNFIFSIMDDDSLLLKKINYFFNNIYQYSNYNLKYYKITEVDSKILHKIINEFYLSDGTTYDYTKLLYDSFYFISKHINKYKILTTLNRKNDNSLTNNYPVILVAAGPSFTKNMQWLKINQNKFIIVAIGAVYKKLFDNEIIPDIVTTVDPKYEILNRTHFNTEDVKLLKDTIVLASLNTPTKILSRFNQERLFLYEVIDSFKKNSRAYYGVSIGEITLSLLLDMNIKNIYLLGTDLAFDEETGQSHFDGYINSKKDFNINDSRIDESIKNKKTSIDDFFYVKGNKKEKVLTNRMFSLSINQYISTIENFKKFNQNIYNLSENGAFIEGIPYINKEEVIYLNIINKDFLLSNIKELSEQGLSKMELKELRRELEKFELLEKVLVEKFQKTELSSNMDEFQIKISFITSFIIKNINDKIFERIISNYLRIVLPYIYYSFNKELNENEVENKMNNIENVFFLQIKRIIEVYQSYLLQIKRE